MADKELTTDERTRNSAQDAETERLSRDGLGAEDIEARGGDERRNDVEEVEQRRDPNEIQRGSKYDDKRKSIYERAKELRAEQQVKSDEAIRSIDDRDEERANADEQREPGDQPPARRMRLKVNGADVELPEEEVVALAQKAHAAGDILEHAKADRLAAQTILTTIQAAQRDTNAAKPSADTKPEDAAPTIEATSEDLDEVVERIQFGDPKEAKAALQKFGDSLVDRAMERIGNLDTKIADTMQIVDENRQRQASTNDTLAEFTRDNPEFASELLAPSLATAATQIMRDTMLKANVRQDTLDGIAAEHPEWTQTQVIGNAYRTLLEKGFQLPNHKDVLTGAAKAIRKQFGLAERTPPAERDTGRERDLTERTERKERLAVQPRRASAPIAAERRESSRLETRQKAVQQMRAARRGRSL